jgi:hypothetical protein
MSAVVRVRKQFRSRAKLLQILPSEKLGCRGELRKGAKTLRACRRGLFQRYCLG